MAWLLAASSFHKRRPEMMYGLIHSVSITGNTQILIF